MSPDRTEQLEATRLYLVCDAQPGGRSPAEFLPRVIQAGVGMVQLRDKTLDDVELLSSAISFREICHEHGALFIVNDRPDIAVMSLADGAHIGQDDLLVADARAIVGPEQILGLSTHSPDQIDAASGVEYIGVGPINETPTKPGRRAVGLELVRYANTAATVPFFAIGGIDSTNIAAVSANGAKRVAIVRALTDASDPAEAARTLRATLA